MSTPIQNNKIADLLTSRTAPATQRPANSAVVQGGPDFSSILADRLKVSKHAETRLQSRELQLDQAKWERVLEGVDRAAQKGAKESLVMVDDIALVVSVRNRTVITAVDQNHLKENVFTNIDSAVIV
ncbi:TIGR02530 family flagellar biosynthesis protein [Kamptonema cortianum]|nr:TIGR02530 family flagellar biosynthesis protein [Geitlerinema splendidum]MDK3156046.1 TIGR02530 family flagellar biosynthesis protein [Kamptonema cortianum]